MSKIFEKLGMKAPNYSAFDLSREQKLSCKMGDLIPTYIEEIIPGDNFKVKTETMLRMAPMLAPIMHRVNLYMHYFFVPNRLVWNQWEDFITGGREGTSNPLYPTMPMTLDVIQAKLSDYMGLPNASGNNPDFSVSQLPFRAYQLIWNEYFRDQNLENPIDVQNASNLILCQLRKRAWEKDYFTSALPWTQRGPEVGIPIDLEYKPVSKVFNAAGQQLGALTNLATGGLPTRDELRANYGGNDAMRIENIENTQLDFTINELRKSSALQRFLEKQARGGARYIETILSHFGVKSEDARLQRPEYLGGGRQPIVISEVLNTTGTDNAPQGDMAGHGISTGTTNSFNKRFTEHGYVLGIMSILPRTAYFQGIPKHFRRFDKFDYYWPEFANLGEQEIKNSELFYDDMDNESNNDTFGYQQRYAEYKYGTTSVHGDFRTTLKYWHLARDFDNLPSLNANFIKADPDSRIFAVDTENPNIDNIWVQMYHSVKARRPMPFFADPRLS